MKAILIAFLLFASLFFLPTSTTARQLKEGSFQTGDPNKPAVNCPPGQSYRSCSPSPKPKPPCSPYIVIAVAGAIYTCCVKQWSCVWTDQTRPPRAVNQLRYRCIERLSWLFNLLKKIKSSLLDYKQIDHVSFVDIEHDRSVNVRRD
ncbi:hypothetical protein DEO72_LG10g2302 [Vigna unguiculata]|uniref:Uncharacterized protein n=1 Tax=Vigna unguiculata TaxID=3917 RepID=A0A4D6NEV0_VIGUN|nr:hypothetical protein DEO72_LG10g2302 [Vigna unguiculata]